MLPVLGLLLAGCGDDATDPFELVSAAGASTLEAGTARMALTADGGPAGEVTGEGLVDMEGNRGALSFEAGGQTAEVAFEGATLFLRVPGGVDPTIETEWISFDLVTLGEAVAGTDLGQLPTSSGDPTSSLAMLKATSEDIEDLGEEDVRGETTTHYRAVVDVRKAYEDADAVTDPARFEAFLDTFGQEELPLDVWIDGDGRVRRMTYAQPLPGGDEVTSTMELYDFGVDERVELPDPADVTDVTDRAVAEAGD